MTDPVDTYTELGTWLGPWLTCPSPLTPDALLDCLRNAEAGTCGPVRDLWGNAALNWEAGINARPGDRPAPAELFSVAIEYAQLARQHETAHTPA